MHVLVIITGEEGIEFTMLCLYKFLFKIIIKKEEEEEERRREKRLCFVVVCLFLLVDGIFHYLGTDLVFNYEKSRMC